MLFQSALLLLAVARIAIADDDAPFAAPSKCSATNTKSASSWESCVTPATAYTSCDSDNKPCACSAYTIVQKCYSKYCPGSFPQTSDLESLCLAPVETTSDYFDNTFFHPSTTSAPTKESKDSQTATETSKAATAGSGSKTPAATGSTSTTGSASGTGAAKPNVAGRVVGGSFGGLLALVVAVLA